MYNYAGKAALITGASSGIGEAFARELAERGMHLILVARTEERLTALADELSKRYSIRAEVMVADLSQPEAIAGITAFVRERGRVIDLLINNAGFATYGPFEELDPQRDHQQVMVNVAAVVDMAHAFLPEMVTRRAGAIINVASRGAFHPAAYMAVYAASKAFVLAFSEGLWAEYRRRGIRVVALCPGPVATRFYDIAGRGAPSLGTKSSPLPVVLAALRALERGKSYVIPSWSSYLQAQVATRLFPRAFAAQMVERMQRPR